MIKKKSENVHFQLYFSTLNKVLANISEGGEIQLKMKIWVTLFISDFVIVVAANHTFGTYSR